MTKVDTNQGYSLYVHDHADPVSEALVINKVWDREGMEFVRKHVKAGDVFVDVGAHIGTYSLLAASLGCKVISFEPDRDNFNLLIKNVELNGFPNMYPINKAIGSVSGQCRLWRNKVNCGDFRVLADDDAAVDHCSAVDFVQISTLDIELGALGIDAVNFVKIDAQGSEALVLAGARGTIGNSSSLLLRMEYAPDWMTFVGSTPLKLYEECEAQGIKLYTVDGLERPRDYFEAVQPAWWFTDIVGRKG